MPKIELYEDETVAALIDGQNNYFAMKALGWQMDFKKLRDWLLLSCRVHRMFYYSAVDESADFDPLIPVLDYMEYNGYRIVKKQAKFYHDAGGAVRGIKRVDVEITIDMLRLPASVDHVLLFSGDGSLVPSIRAAQDAGKRVTVLSTMEGGIVSDDMRRVADQFIDLKEMRHELERLERQEQPARVLRDTGTKGALTL